MMAASNVLPVFLFLSIVLLNSRSSEAKNMTSVEELVRIMISGKNEDAFLKTSGLIQKYGYPFQLHTLRTSDGYILELHRIPYGKEESIETAFKKRPVVYLQHGVLCSSSIFVLSGPEKALAFMLADAGYDVWMGNHRGTKYSRKHVTLSTDDDKFWDFSFHEIGMVDVPESIDYVLGHTKETDLYYVGHSQGNTAFYVMCSEIPKYNKKIKMQFSLAPVAYMGNLFSPLMKFIASSANALQYIQDLFGAYEFLPNTSMLKELLHKLCSQDEASKVLCANMIFAVTGFNWKSMNLTLLPVILGHFPAGASTKQFIHFGQEINSGKFRQYDYGQEENMDRYNSTSPPKYNLNNVTAPVYIYYSQNDWLCHEIDSLRVCNELTSCQATILVDNGTYSHMDYLVAIDAPNLVYKNVIKLMKK